MSDAEHSQDPAFPLMAVDIISQVLHRAENPAAVGVYLSEAIRELTGAACVVFLKQVADVSEVPRIFSLHPERKRAWVESPGMQPVLCEAVRECRMRVLGPSDCRALGTQERVEGQGDCLIIPLQLGAESFGTLVLLGMPEKGARSGIEALLQDLAVLVALVLRNAALYEKQEALVAQRTQELEKANRALQLTQLSVDSATDAIFWLNSEARFIYFNRAACQLLGCAPEELAHKHVYDFNPEHPPKAWAQHWAMLKERRRLTFESTLVPESGRQLPVEISATFVEFGGQELNFASVRDLSERRAMEARLQQSQKMEAIGQLAGGIAHDFNNILAAMMLQVGMVQGSPGMDPETCQALQDISEAAKRAADLTRQLLIFSRRSVMRTEAVDIAELISGVSKFLIRLIGENIDYSADLAEDLPPVLGDRNMLELVIMNLVINARDALPSKGMIRLAVQVCEINEASAREHPSRIQGRHVCLSVRDSGVGMSPTTLEHIFEPFFTTKEVGKGTGLGLATAHGIVQQHKGWIEVESEPKQGTCFRVFLPAAGPVSTEKEKPKEMIQGGAECVLLVEDEAPLRLAASLGLKHFGYRVLQAENGEQALALWTQHKAVIRLLMTDMVMPGNLSGYDIAARCRDESPELKIIISSGYSTTLPELDKLHDRAIHFLPKPYDIQTLGETVRAVLDSNPHRPA